MPGLAAKAASSRLSLSKPLNLVYYRGLSDDSGSSAMSRVCQVTGKKPMRETTFPMRIIKTLRRFCPTCITAGSGFEGENRWSACVCRSGAAHYRQESIDVVLAELRARGRAGLTGAHHEREIKLESSAGTGHFYTTPRTSAPSGKNRNEEVRSGGAQARDLQGNQDQVTVPAIQCATGNKKARLMRAFFMVQDVTLNPESCRYA